MTSRNIYHGAALLVRHASITSVIALLILATPVGDL